MFDRFFNRKKQIISYESLRLLEDFLFDDIETFKFDVQNELFDTVHVNLHMFPDTFEEGYTKRQLEKEGYTNSIDLLNGLFKKFDIDTVSANINDGSGYYFTKFYFRKFDEKLQDWIICEFLIFLLTNKTILIAYNYRNIESPDNEEFASYFLSFEKLNLKAKNKHFKAAKNDLQIILKDAFNYIDNNPEAELKQ